jgi:hypothetical protein
MTTLLDTAMYWKRVGVATIPIQYRDKHPDGRLLPKGDDGKPTWEPFQKALPTDEQLKQWFPSSVHNLAVITGWQNLLVLDFDELGTFLKWSLWVTRTGGLTRRAVELTYMVQTARGVHVYFRTRQPEQNRKLDGIDIKARGGYVLAPPSIHPSGAEYRVRQNGVPMVIDALSEVLPAAYLVKNTELPPVVSVPSQQVQTTDVWDAIMNGPDPDRDLVSQIRAKHRIENFFPNAQNTGGNGRWKMDCCPFHDDKHPSFWIDTQRQICACYGGCTPKPLDVINLYARLHGLTNHDAIFYLAHM